MNLPEDALFSLIQSMDKNEKRYFKLFAQQSGKKSNNSILLFDLIVRQKSYDERQIKRKLRGKKLTNQLSVTKKYLYELLLKSLRNFHAKSDVESEILTGLEDVKRLVNKRLPKLAKSRLSLLKKRAIQFDQVLYLPRILEWELTLENIFFAYKGYSDESFEVIKDEYKYATQRLDRLTNFHTMLSYVQYVIQSKSPTELLNESAFTPYQKTILKTIQEEGTEELSGRVWMAFQKLKSIWHAKINKPSIAFDADTAIVVYLEKNAQLLKDQSYFDAYVLALMNSLASTLEMKLKKQFDELYSKFKQLDQVRMPKFLRLHCNKLGIIAAYRFGNTEKGIALIKDFEKRPDEYCISSDAPFIMVIYFCAIMIYFQAERFDDSLEYIKKGLERVKESHHSEAKGFLFLFELLCYYEKKETLLLPYLVRSYYRFLSHKKTLNEFEKVMFQFLRKLSRGMVYENEKKLFEEALRVFSQLNNENYELIFQFDYISWLESKIEGCSYAEILREKFEQRIEKM